MDELENIAKRAEAFERQAEEANTWEDAEEKPRQAGAVSGVDPSEAAGNMAENFLRIGEAAAKLFADSRLMLDEAEILSGRASLSPVIEKYNLAGSGDGNLPYQAEISAGFYLGGLWKRFKRALAALRAEDRAKAEANQQSGNKANNGEERKYKSEEQSQSLPSPERLRQESDPDSPGWLR